MPLQHRGALAGEAAARARAPLAALSKVLETEFDRGRGFLWLPVAMGTGIAAYFAWPFEPPLWWSSVGVGATGLVAMTMARQAVVFRVAVLLCALALGFGAATLRTSMHAPTPVPTEMTAAVSGWIVSVEDAARDGRRIYLRVASIEDWRRERLPRTIRFTVRGDLDAFGVGDGIEALVRLIPPSGPLYPGGFDFARHAFFAGYDAVGFAYGNVASADLGAAPFDIRLRRPIAELRETIRARVEAALPGDRGEIAAALITGDRGGISEATQDAMRASGLGHILAISGLHMALVSGTAFWLIRALLALSSTLALRAPIKRYAAVGALAVASFYLAISGAGIATQRAYIMLAIMLLAVLVGRRAITLRNVALSAIVILLIEPESLLSASFQMSFAATAALVAGYEVIGARFGRARSDGAAALAIGFVVGLAITSLIAGLATTPIALFQFQRVAPLNLIANLAAMPAVGGIVMPFALLSVVAMGVGLEALPLTVMGWGIEWVVAVAKYVTSLTGDAGLLPAAPRIALILYALGFVWLIVWSQKWRLAGLLPMAFAAAVALTPERPILIVDADASAVAIRGADGRYNILRTRRESFVVNAWLRSDGDGRTAADRTLERGTTCDELGCVGRIVASEVIVAFATSRLALADDCLRADIVITRFDAPATCLARVIDRGDLNRGGAHAVYLKENMELQLVTAYPKRRRPFMHR